MVTTLLRERAEGQGRGLVQDGGEKVMADGQVQGEGGGGDLWVDAQYDGQDKGDGGGVIARADGHGVGLV